MHAPVNYIRRAVLSVVGGVLIHPPSAWSATDSPIDVQLTITDEAGRPIPYATVWAYVLPRKNPLALDAADLRRLALRYRETFDLAAEFNPIVSRQLILPMGDARGKADWRLSYQWLEGSQAVRPPAVSMGFAVMKRGYLPAFVDFTVTDQTSVRGDLVLKRDPAEQGALPPYLQEFDRLRYDLSDTRRNQDVSEAAHQRVERLGAAMQAAAEQAISAGDRPAAARIYARMQYLPVVRFVQGRPAGFAQADPYSAQSWGYLLKAYELDPANPYIAAKRLFRDGAERFGGRRYEPQTATEAQRRAFEAFLAEARRLMSEHGEQIWPGWREVYALWYRKASDPRDRERVLPLLEQLYKDEPKFQTRENLLRLPP